MKRLIAVALAMGIVLGLASCGIAPEKNTKKNSGSKTKIAAKADKDEHYYKYFVISNNIFKIDTDKYTREEIKDGAEGEIIIPEGVKMIGSFAGCKNITRVVIPEGVTELPRACFQNCEALEEVILPDSLTTLKGATFASCKNLRSITMPKSLKAMKDNAEFWRCGEIAIYFPKEVELEVWTNTGKPGKGFSTMPINTFNNITIYVVKDSWMDKHFEDLYVDSSSASELAAKKGEKRKDMPPKAYWEG